MLTDRQRFAIGHATEDQPAQGCEQQDGPWLTGLQVIQNEDEPVKWIAYVCRQKEPGKCYQIKDWEPGWIQQAHTLLADLLHGVGDNELTHNVEDYGFDPGESYALSRAMELTEHEKSLVRQVELVWWISFATNDRFLGVSLCKGADLKKALVEAHRHGCNPGGSVQAVTLSFSVAEKISGKELNVLMDENMLQHFCDRYDLDLHQGHEHG